MTDLAGARGETTPERPFRVGVWAYNGSITLLTEGIGVYVHNVIRGFLDGDEPVEVVLVVGPDDADHPTVREFQDAGGSHFRVVTVPKIRSLPRAIVRTPLRAAAKRYHDLRRVGGPREIVSHLRLKARDGWRSLSITRRALLALSLLLALPAAVLAAPVAILALPFLSQLKWVGSHVKAWSERPPRFDVPAILGEAGADAWLVPYVLIGYPLREPSVLVIHDLVPLHFPTAFPKAMLRAIRRKAPRHAKRATICACMAEFIKDVDLKGQLGLPDAKIAVVRPAAPTDFPQTTPAVEAAIRQRFPRPFLLYPAAFRPYKNHEALVEALAELHRRGHPDLDVVFTGAGAMGDACRAAIERHGLKDHVHQLQFVSRAELAALYRQAFATVVPSLYEQGSFPVYEALHFGCPVACSNIPSLVEQNASIGDAMLYFDPRDASSLADAVTRILADREGVRSRQAAAKSSLWQRTWTAAASEWLLVLREAAARKRDERDSRLLSPEQREARGWPAEVAHWGAHNPTSDPIESDGKTLRPAWPREESAPIVRSTPPELFLFLPLAYEGGVRQAVRGLLENLIEVNWQRRQIRLSLGIELRHPDFDIFRRPGDPLLSLSRMRLSRISRLAASHVLGSRPDWLDARPDEGHLFFDIGGEAALRADAWMSLSDRFMLPLLPLRPYGLTVYDVIQRHVPEAFGGPADIFAKMNRHGIGPTVRGAERILVTSPPTAMDVTAEWGVPADRVRVVPVACEPHARFADLSPEPVPVPGRGFILDVANAAAHKGGEVMLAGYAKLKSRLGDAAPPLVLCGWNTQMFSPALRDNAGSLPTELARFLEPRRPAADAPDDAHWQGVRRIITTNGLREGRDVFLLGYVTDAQLADLFSRAGVVVNAARYDNGTYSLIEAAWFGKPGVSSRYPAAEWLYERFGLPVRYFPVGDPAGLADALAQTFATMSVPRDLGPLRAAFASPEFSHRRFAERMYDLLVELATTGRNSRAGETPARPLRLSA